jgi:hypothetical protein
MEKGNSLIEEKTKWEDKKKCQGSGRKIQLFRFKSYEHIFGSLLFKKSPLELPLSYFLPKKN